MNSLGTLAGGMVMMLAVMGHNGGHRPS